MLQPGIQYLINLKCQPWVLVFGSVAVLGKTSCIIAPTEKEFAWPPLPSAQFTYTFRWLGLSQFDYDRDRYREGILATSVPSYSSTIVDTEDCLLCDGSKTAGTLSHNVCFGWQCTH